MNPSTWGLMKEWTFSHLVTGMSIQVLLNCGLSFGNWNVHTSPVKLGIDVRVVTW